MGHAELAADLVSERMHEAEGGVGKGHAREGRGIVHVVPGILVRSVLVRGLELPRTSLTASRA